MLCSSLLCVLSAPPSKAGWTWGGCSHGASVPSICTFPAGYCYSFALRVVPTPPLPSLGAGVCGRGERREGRGAGHSFSRNHMFWLLPRCDRPDLLGDLVNTVNLALYQVFDATNTTRERRHMILNFAKENDFKVSQMSNLARECSGERKTLRNQLICPWSFSFCCPGFATCR